MNSITPVFIGGCPRSGTTLLADLLGGAASCVVTPESQFKTAVIQELPAAPRLSQLRDRIASHWRFAHWGFSLGQSFEDRQLRSHADYGEAILQVVEEYAASQGGDTFGFWIDHTPSNFKRAGQLVRMFPEARFVHIVRDPRAIAASVMQRDWGPNTVRQAARWWLQNLAYGLAFEGRFPDRCQRVRYEDLVEETEAEIGRLYDWMGVDENISPDAGNYDVPAYTRQQHDLIGQAPDPSRTDRWKKALSPRQVEIIEHDLGTMLELFGYVAVFENPRKISRFELWRGRLKEGAMFPVMKLKRYWRAWRAER